MALMTILDRAQAGAFYANAGAAAGLGEAEARAAMAKLCPAYAEALRRRAEDAEAFEALLDLLEDDGEDAFLDDPAALADAEIQEDGAAILKDLYGTAKKAQAQSAAIAGDVPPAALQKISAISAASVLAVLARTNQPQRLASAEPAQQEGGGLLGTIVSALVEGVVQGAQRSLAPKRRRRRYTSYYGTRRRKRTTRRRARTPTLDDIFGQILGTRRR